MGSPYTLDTLHFTNLQPTPYTIRPTLYTLSAGPRSMYCGGHGVERRERAPYSKLYWGMRSRGVPSDVEGRVGLAVGQRRVEVRLVSWRTGLLAESETETQRQTGRHSDRETET